MVQKKKSKVHIDNMYMLKKLDEAYTAAFNRVYDRVIKEPSFSDMDKNIIINIALEQCISGMKNNKKAAHVIPKDVKEYIAKYSRGSAYREMKRTIRNQDYEKFSIASVWLVFSVCIVLFFIGMLIEEDFLINYWVSLGVTAVALVFAFQNYRIKKRIIQRYQFGNFYFILDAVTLAVCIAVKLVSKINFDITYLLLVIVFFVTKRKIKPQFEKAAE